MSLDVYLEMEWPEDERQCFCTTCGNEHQRTDRMTVYDANITHNLGAMAGEAGIYEALWRPDEIGVSKAIELVALLEAGLVKLKADPERFEKFNAPNGWGLYKHFVPFVEAYLAACRENPTALVRVSR